VNPLRALLARIGWARSREAGLFVLTCAMCAALLTEWRFQGDLDLVEGEVAGRDVVASQSFTFADEAATGDRQAAAESQVAPVFVVDLTAQKRVENRVMQAFDMARRRYSAALEEAPRKGIDPSTREAIVGDFIGTLELGLEAGQLAALADAAFSAEAEELTIELVGVALRKSIVEDRNHLGATGPITVVTRVGDTRDESTLDDRSQLRSPEEARQAVSLYVLERFGAARNAEAVNAAAAIARAAVAPNFAWDPQETQARRKAARDAVGTVEVGVRRGARLVRAGDTVTPRQILLVSSMRAAGARVGGAWRFLAFLAYSLALVGSTVSFATRTVRKFARRLDELVAVSLVLVGVLGLSRLVVSSSTALDLPNSWDIAALALLAPVAGGAMLVRILVNSETALVWAIPASLLTAAMTDQSALLAAYYLATALVAAAGVGQARERLVLLRAGVQAGAVGAALVVLVALIRSQSSGMDASGIDWGHALGLSATALGAGVLNAMLALGMVPAFELLGFVTDYKLLELASLNHPLLKQLMLRAPGTYHHSVIVGSLSEAACETIGANALLARVACYFHDIGKGLKPQYFVENQREGLNRHDRLSPAQSAAVIINHVREGAVLARQYNLPPPIIDNIFMHHGTGIIQYFYARAKEQAQGEPVDDELFRYPGPKPDSREAGIIMLADKVEAACRTIREPNEARIRAMIQSIVNAVMSDGQFESCPLTLRELYQIADTFTTVLLGIYHHRIEYPETRGISASKGKFIPIPRQGTITLEIVNPLRPPPPGSASNADYESAENLPPTPPPETDDS
jgi:putative nucleotidyltransferase with HDIG domain